MDEIYKAFRIVLERYGRGIITQDECYKMIADLNEKYFGSDPFEETFGFSSGDVAGFQRMMRG